MTIRQRGTLAVAILGSAIVFLDGSFVHIALPRIGAELQSSLLGRLEAQTYVTSGYLATLAAFLVLAGALGDYYGRKRIFLIGLAGFGATSVLCGLAPNLELLVVGRVLQGVAGSLLVPASLAIITSTFEGPSRARAFGLWAAVTSALATLGPPIGGILVEVAGWRSMFLINLPLVLVGAWLTTRYMDESRDESASPNFDWLGAFVAAVAIGGLAFGAIRGQQGQWKEPIAFVALGIGAVALVAFPILMAKRANPLVPLELFRNRPFSTINLSTLLIYGALYANLGFQSLFLQSTLGYSPLGTALIGLPTGILLTLLSTRVGSLSGRFGVRPFLIAGPLVMALGLLWWLRVPSTSQPWTATLSQMGSLVPPVDAIVGPLPAVLIFGLGLALLVAPLTTGLMSSVPVRNAGIASAINNALSRVGQPLVAATVFIVVSGTFYSVLATAAPGTDPSSPELRAAYEPLNPPPADAPPALVAAVKVASTNAYHLAAIVGAGLLVAGAAVNAIGLRPSRSARGGGARGEGAEGESRGGAGSGKA
ncbi:MAG TPA: MFS transporter [Candidatus Limnocylindria bacterium]|nr:MFS transporter [Candidatus Limnocylindria bacterium]